MRSYAAGLRTALINVILHLMSTLSSAFLKMPQKSQIKAFRESARDSNCCGLCRSLRAFLLDPPLLACMWDYMWRHT